MGPAIETKNLRKSFGNVPALCGIDLVIPQGQVVALLGPNGAGKTTLVRILTTLLNPDMGTASIFGYDLGRHEARIREIIGLTGQFTAIDENLTGRENLELTGQLYHLKSKEVRQRTKFLLEKFSLIDSQDRLSKTYSGGMRRRLDLAMSLIGSPKILFLDEPTTGLDPQGRKSMWEIIKKLSLSGITVLLTTQYLDEADYLANEIAVMDHGRLIAQGTSRELKSRVGGDVLEIHTENEIMCRKAADTLADLGKTAPHIDLTQNRITIPVLGNVNLIAEAVRILDQNKIPIVDIALHRPTLDDVFFALTGRTTS